MRYNMSEQEKLDRIMCKPGYTWNKTLKKCLGGGGGLRHIKDGQDQLRDTVENSRNQPQNPPKSPEIPTNSGNSANQAVNSEVKKRASA